MTLPPVIKLDVTRTRCEDKGRVHCYCLLGPGGPKRRSRLYSVVSCCRCPASFWWRDFSN
jgi:hypothetical protein